MEPVRNPKLADAIAEHIEQLILEGTLRPGERLASERELSEKLEVSRPSLREALDKLEVRRLLRTTRGGTYVAHFMAPLTEPLATLMQSNEQVIVDYLEYRKLVEGAAARLAAERATEFDRQAIRTCLERMKAAHGLDDPTAEATADADLHMLIYEACHNLVVLHVMRAFSEMLRSDVFYNRHRLYVTPGVRDLLLAQHIAVAEAVVAGDPDRAEAAASEHIRYTAETLTRLRDDEKRLGRALRRFGRHDIVAG
ncbi:MAG: FCD domain-containing protein [Siculibacillus sp.]|nr:FCD domain-containing protein [Siculibacillus sp.]